MYAIKSGPCARSFLLRGPLQRGALALLFVEVKLIKMAKMTLRPLYAFLVTAGLLAGCSTTSAALDGVGGVFTGAGQDVRSLNRR